MLRSIEWLNFALLCLGIMNKAFEYCLNVYKYWQAILRICLNQHEDFVILYANSEDKYFLWNACEIWFFFKFSF